MPLYYFSFENGHRIRDPLGEEFPDDEAALGMAFKIAADLARTKSNPGSHRVVVRDTNDTPIGEASLRAAKRPGSALALRSARGKRFDWPASMRPA